MIRPALFLCGLVVGCSVFGQRDTLRYYIPVPERNDEISLLAGYQASSWGFVELSLARTMIKRAGGRCGLVPPGTASYYLGAEMRPDRPELMGVKAGAYVSAFLAFGMQFIHYMEQPTEGDPGSDGQRTMQVLRPEIGIGLTRFRMTYGYNLRLTQPRIEGINTHMFTFSYAFRVARLPGDDGHRSKR